MRGRREQIVYAGESTRLKSGYIRWKMVDDCEVYIPISISISISIPISVKRK